MEFLFMQLFILASFLSFAFSPLTYDAPDFLRFLTFAAVSHDWYQAVLRAVRDRTMIDLPHLLRVSQRLEDTFEWIHRPNED